MGMDTYRCWAVSQCTYSQCMCTHPVALGCGQFVHIASVSTHTALGIILGRFNINNICYADDMVHIAYSRKKLQEMLDVVVKCSDKKGLSVKLKKIEYMIITNIPIIPACEIKIGNQRIKHVDKFRFLDTIIQTDGKCETEIKARIGMAKEAFNEMKRVFRSHSISLKTKKQLLRTYMYPIRMLDYH